MKILVIGAGEVAARKVEKLLLFVQSVDCIAARSNEEMSQLQRDKKINLQLKKFEDSDLKDYEMIIVAADDIELQKHIYSICTKNKTYCNSVDSPDYCNFIFPALVVKEPMVIGITSSGQAPGVSSAIRKKIESIIPENISEIVLTVRDMRAKLKGEGLSTMERGRVIIDYIKSIIN